LNLQDLHINKDWTLFLDRDGVINYRLVDDYVKRPEEFYFIPGVLDALPVLNKLFNKIIIVTNQQGIGKKLFSENDLKIVHTKMLQKITEKGAHIHSVYYSPHLKSENSLFRKPQIGMALQAQKDFPNINFSKSIMVGDSISDIQFGKNAGMYTVWIGDEPLDAANFHFTSLYSFAQVCNKHFNL
jgi:D-glycero-D-manno-heptose 1,7-bisphosphate phosphatase